MNKEEILKTGRELGLKLSHETENYVVFYGVNGQRSLFYKNLTSLKDFYNHIHQMGRDSLKMDLEKLLNITKHN